MLSCRRSFLRVRKLFFNNGDDVLFVSIEVEEGVEWWKEKLLREEEGRKGGRRGC